MSLFSWKRFVAKFVDDNGDDVGTKVFGYTFGSLGQLKSIFDYKGGTYHIKPNRSSQLFLNKGFRIMFDDYIYVYKINNPDPIVFKNGKFIPPVFDARDYKQVLESKHLVDLNKAASGGFEIPWKWLGLALLIFIVFMVLTKGNFSFGGSKEVVNETVVENARNLIPLAFLKFKKELKGGVE